jgi:hypothetical protein
MTTGGKGPGWPVTEYVDPAGRPFGYVHIRRDGNAPLAIHFSAFFGKWGDARPYRDRFQGYFHRLRMLGDGTPYNWLFLCDSYGAFSNGTYYTGQAGDLFVEAAILRILDMTASEFGYDLGHAVTVGSSMGGTAALKFGLMRQMRGIVAIGPHIDLDISGLRQNRVAEVAWIVPDGDPAAEANWAITRQIRNLVHDWPVDVPLPRLFLQSCSDDSGVHDEQVMPLATAWRAAGGWVTLDVRPSGGHTSDYATRALLLDAIGKMFKGADIDVDAYQSDALFRGALTRPPLSYRVRRAASILRKRAVTALRR